MQLLQHTSFWLTLGSLLIIWIFEDKKSFLETNISYELIRDLNYSCIAAILLNLTNYYVLSILSPLSYLVIGHIKTIIILILGILFFEHKFPSNNTIIGTIIALIGVLLYSYENSRQQQQKDKKIPIESHIQSQQTIIKDEEKQ